MSWFSKNYEKAALGGAAVVALGLAFLGWTKINKVDSDFATELKGVGNNDPSVKNADLVPKALGSLQSPRIWDQGEAQGRPVDLFTGIPLFVGRNPTDKPVDPVGSPVPIHAPIPNSWWIQYRLDPGFGDSPQRDADGDGFSNLEEFNAKTDPTDAKQFPSLVAKLKYLHDQSLVWVVRPGFESEGGFTFTYEDSARGTNRATAAAIIMPGQLFFTEGVMKNRFKLLGAEVRKVMNERIKEEQDVTFVRIEDQKENKKGKIYEIPASFREDLKNNYRNYDRTAVLSLDALGLGGSEFKVDENTSFSLPPDGPNKTYLLKSVTPEGIEVEYKDADGATKTIQIPKG
jgi:hypothetical protein